MIQEAIFDPCDLFRMEASGIFESMITFTLLIEIHSPRRFQMSRSQKLSEGRDPITDKTF